MTFCTSHSSGLGSSAENLHALVPERVTWLESRRFPAGASREHLKDWLEEIGLYSESGGEKELTDFLPQVTITPALVQNEIHPYYQERDVVPFIQEKGIVVQCWYPLGGRGHTATLLGDETIKTIAEAHGVTRAEIAAIITHTTMYVGWPKGWAVFRLAKEVWDDEAPDASAKDAC